MTHDCPHCDDLRERIAWLESELGLRVDPGKAETVRRALKVTPQAASILLALFQAGGQMVSRAMLDDAMPAVRRDPDFSTNVVDVMVCKARKRLGRDAIENVWGRGYRMTPDGLARVGAILAGACENVGTA